MKRLRIDPAAQTELRSAISWYQTQREGLGLEFHQEVKRLLALLPRQPEMGQVVPNLKLDFLVRRVLLRRFPFFVVYRSNGSDLEILAFAHTSRKPGYWRARLT